MMDRREKPSLSVSRVKVLLYGFLIWTLWIIFYAIFFKINVGQSWSIAFISSANNYYIYGLLSIGIWFICRRIPFGGLPVPVLLLIHFILSIVCSVLWLFLTYGMWYLQDGRAIFEYVDIRAIIGWQFLFGMISYLLIAGIFYTIIYYKHFREKELREAELRLLTRDAEFKALKMQINPHFLFNALNSINALVTQNPSLSRKMIGRLSELLRMSLESRDKMLVPLHEELDFVHLYLEIENIRFRERMHFKEDIDEGLLEVVFPGMVLQPLIENAVKHGIAEKRGRGEIYLNMKQEEDRILTTITNTARRGRSRKGEGESVNGTGLQNIRRRLDLLYSGDYDLHAGFTDLDTFEVKLSIPLKSYERD